jgi:O-antigen/teichoic acid export membrane protein
MVPIFILKVYGQAYADAGGYFRILAFKYFITGCYALLGGAIMGLGKFKYNFMCNDIAACFNCVYFCFLTILRSIWGCGCSNSCGYVFVVCALVCS